MEISNLSDILELLKQVKYIERKPIKFDSLNGNPIEYKEILHYYKVEDITIGIEGSFSIYFSEDLSKILKKEWRPIILNKEYCIYPVDSSSHGYRILSYKMARYINKEKLNNE